MTKKQEEILAQAVTEMREAQQNGDIEGAHGHADAILCQVLVKLGFQDLVTEYEKVSKWYA